MERPTHEAVNKEPAREADADDGVQREDAHRRPKREWREPVSERTPEEAGYGYGV
ncbi:MAG: hypothetical protein AB7F99_09010 [Vicinamibacterales bacterium]